MSKRPKSKQDSVMLSKKKISGRQNHTKTHRSRKNLSKTKRNKIKTHVELREDRATHRSIEYLGKDQELLSEIKELWLTITQQFLLELWGKE